MKLYLVKDKMSNQVIDVVLSTNLDTYKRQLINAYLDVKQKNNFSAIRLWNDCEVYEAVVSVDGEFTITGIDGTHSLERVLVIKDFIADFEAKKGTNLDKSD